MNFHTNARHCTRKITDMLRVDDGSMVIVMTGPQLEYPETIFLDPEEASRFKDFLNKPF